MLFGGSWWILQPLWDAFHTCFHIHIILGSGKTNDVEDDVEPCGTHIYVCLCVYPRVYGFNVKSDRVERGLTSGVLWCKTAGQESINGWVFVCVCDYVRVSVCERGVTYHIAISMMFKRERHTTVKQIQMRNP